MFRLLLRLMPPILLLFCAACVLALLGRIETPVAALVYSQFSIERGRTYVYVDPVRGTRARQTGIYHFGMVASQERLTSPDGTMYIATLPTPDGVDLFVVHLGEGARRQLQSPNSFPLVERAPGERRSNTYPVWSPDGRWIAFISSDVNATLDIYVVAPDGSDLRRVARDVGTSAPLQLRWSRFEERPLDLPLLVMLLAALILLIYPKFHFGKPQT